jgi:hypothetical protein
VVNLDLLTSAVEPSLYLAATRRPANSPTDIARIDGWTFIDSGAPFVWTSIEIGSEETMRPAGVPATARTVYDPGSVSGGI